MTLETNLTGALQAIAKDVKLLRQNNMKAVSPKSDGTWNLTPTELNTLRAYGAVIVWMRQKADGTFVAQPTTAHGRVQADYVQLQSGELLEPLVYAKGVVAVDTAVITGSGVELNGRLVDNVGLTPAPATTLSWSVIGLGGGGSPKAQVQPTDGITMYGGNAGVLAELLPLQPLTNFRLQFDIRDVTNGVNGGVVFRHAPGALRARYAMLLQTTSTGTITVLTSDYSSGSEVKTTLGTIPAANVTKGMTAKYELNGSIASVTVGGSTFSATLPGAALALESGAGLFTEAYSNLKANYFKYEVI